jgi:hypothetical protein
MITARNQYHAARQCAGRGFTDGSLSGFRAVIGFRHVKFERRNVFRLPPVLAWTQFRSDHPSRVRMDYADALAFLAECKAGDSRKARRLVLASLREMRLAHPSAFRLPS